MNRISLFLVSLTVLLSSLTFAQTKVFYVSPTGNDSILDSANSASNPFQTPNRAQQAITNLGTCSLRTTPVQVDFETGLYALGSVTGTYAGPWILGSGTGCSNSHVTFTNYLGGNPVISGGAKLSMTRIGTSSYYSATLPSTLTSYSPEALYYNNTRRFRTRGGAASGSGLAGLVGAYSTVTQIATCGSGGTDPCYDRFQYTAGDPPDSVASWSNYHGWNPGGQPSTSPCFSTTTQPANDGDIEILIIEKWTMSRERIACVDTTLKIVYLEGSTVQTTDHGYITGHRYLVENENTGTGGSPGLLPGQFFIDRTVTPYALYYRAQTGETPNTANVVIPVLVAGSTTGAVVSATGLQYVTFTNLQFSHDNYVPGSAGFGAIQSNTNLPAAVTCMDCANTTFTVDTFTQTVANALWFETDSSSTASPVSNSITYNYFYDLGSDGLVYGDLPQVNDTTTNMLHSGTIEENLFQGYGRMYAGASGLEHPFGHDTTIENNDVTDGYNTGIGVCIPNATRNCGGTGVTSGASASNITGDLNHVWNIGKGVTDDMGAFYIATYGATGNTVENNRLHDVQDAQPYDADGYGGNGIYLDNTTGNITVENNLVFRVTEHAVQNTQGPPGSGDPNTIHNNILAYARVGMFYEGGTGVPNYLSEIISNNIFYFDRVFNSTCGIGLDTNQCAYYVQSGCTVLNSAPLVAQTWNPNLYWDTATAFGGTSYSHAFFTDTTPVGTNVCPKSTFYTFTGWQGLGQEAGGAVFAPAFVNPTCTDSTAVLCAADSTQDNFNITGVGVGQTLTITTGNFFTAFSMTAPGRQSPPFTPSAIQDTFPTLMFSTVTSAGNF